MIWIVIVILIVLDQVTKSVVASNPAVYGNIEVIPNFFYITFVRNTGAAWSMLAGQRAFLSLLAAVAIFFMLMFLLKEKKNGSRLTTFALGLMIAGAAGNLLDRLMLGYVRVFLNFYIFSYDFPVFNVADICLTIGVALLIFASLFEKDETKEAVVPDVIEPEKDRTGV